MRSCRRGTECWAQLLCAPIAANSTAPPSPSQIPAMRSCREVNVRCAQLLCAPTANSTAPPSPSQIPAMHTCRRGSECWAQHKGASTAGSSALHYYYHSFFLQCAPAEWAASAGCSSWAHQLSVALHADLVPTPTQQQVAGVVKAHAAAVVSVGAVGEGARDVAGVTAAESGHGAADVAGVAGCGAQAHKCKACVR
eukprot:scaffold61657_cov24-Tisochrysis_lutea.AAC.2